MAGDVLEMNVHSLDPGVPDAATALAINLTADAAAAEGYLTAWPCGEAMPPTSTLNYGPGAPAAAGALIGVGRGSLCIYSYADADVVVDLTGWADPYASTTGSLAPLPPRRAFDTRSDRGGPLPAGASA